MTLIDSIVLVLFVLIIFFIGMSFSSNGATMKSFFAAGGAVPWWLNGLSLFMSFFSAGTFVVWGSIIYSQGVVSLSIRWMMCLVGILVGTFIATRCRRISTLTVAEYLTKCFGYQTQKLYTSLFLIIVLFSTSAFLYPVAKIVEVSTWLNISLSILLLGTIITIYTASGGRWAAIVTDVLQFLVLFAAVLLAVPLTIELVSGYSLFIEKVPEPFYKFTNQEYTGTFLIAFGIYNLVFKGGNWAYVQQYTSIHTSQDAKKVGWLFGALYTISPVIWMLPPMLYHAIEPSIEGLDIEGAYLMASKAVMPVGLLGLVLGGMVFATASSVNTTLNIFSGVLINDVHRRFAIDATERKLPCYKQWHSKGIYQIPYRSNVSRELGNLWLAGRIISATHTAFHSSRVMATCTLGGQTLGMVTALAFERHLSPSQLVRGSNIQELQQRVSMEGQSVPYMAIGQERILLSKAIVTTLRTFKLSKLPFNGDWLSLEQSASQLLPLQMSRPLSLEIQVRSKRKTILNVEFKTSSRLGNFAPDVLRESLALKIGEEEQFMEIPFKENLEKEQYIIVLFRANADIENHTSETRLTGVLSMYNKVNKAVSNLGKLEPEADIGIDVFEFWTSARRPEGKYIAMSFKSPLQLFDKTKLGNDYLRLTTQTNTWAAKINDKELLLTFEWEIPQKIHKVRLFFDNDYPLEFSLQGHTESKIPFCVQEYQLLNDESEVIFEKSDNRQTINTITFENGSITSLLKLKLKQPMDNIPNAILEILIS